MFDSENTNNKPTREDVLECAENLKKGLNGALVNNQKRAITLFEQGEITTSSKEQIVDEINSIRETSYTIIEMLENCDIQTYKQLKKCEKSINNVVSNMIMGLVELIALRLENERDQEI